MKLRIRSKAVDEVLHFRFYDIVTLTFETDVALPPDTYILGADVARDIFNTPCVWAEAAPDGTILTFRFQCDRQAFHDKIEKNLSDRQDGRFEIRAMSDMRIIAAGDVEFEKSVFVSGFAEDTGPVERPASVEYVEQQIETLKSDLEPKLDLLLTRTESHTEKLNDISTGLGIMFDALEAQLDGGAL